jgi:hypothetical protein
MMPVKEVSVDSDSKVTTFPKAKRQTPEDLDALPLAHVCSVDDNIQSFRWCIHMKGDGLWFICSNCGLGLDMQTVLDCFEGE